MATKARRVHSPYDMARLAYDTLTDEPIFICIAHQMADGGIFTQLNTSPLVTAGCWWTEYTCLASYLSALRHTLAALIELFELASGPGHGPAHRIGAGPCSFSLYFRA